MAFIVEQEKLWDTLKAMRSAILKATETLREQNIIKRSLDSRVVMFIDPSAEYAKQLEKFFKHLSQKGESVDEFFKQFAIVSQFEQADKANGLSESSLPGMYLLVEKARGEKCPRCWQWSETKHKDKLCPGCEQVVA